MKTWFKCTMVLMIALLMMAAGSLQAKNPTYSCIAKNDTLLSPRVYQFDIYIYRTGFVPLYLNNYQLAFTIQNSGLVANGGIITGSYVAGSTELAGFAPTNVNATNFAGLTILRVDGPEITQSGILIPTSGLKVGTFRITNTVDYGQAKMRLSCSNSGPYYTRVYSISGREITAITDFTGSHTAGFTDPVLNKPVAVYNMTGAGLNCTGGTGRVLGLDNSEPGVKYRLVKDKATAMDYIEGTGTPITFGTQPEGTYSCFAYREATYLTGNMKNDCGTTTGIETTVNSGSTGMIIQNYPNPFTSKTTVLFILPENNNVKLEVYDLAGKLIQTLYNGTVDKNREYRTDFDGTGLPTGIYIYKMTTNDDVVTGKMMLNKE